MDQTCLADGTQVSSLVYRNTKLFQALPTQQRPQIHIKQIYLIR